MYHAHTLPWRAAVLIAALALALTALVVRPWQAAAASDDFRGSTSSVPQQHQPSSPGLGAKAIPGRFSGPPGVVLDDDC